MMRHRARLAYVGTRFAGWQRQAGEARTVQGVLEAVLSEIDGAPVACVAAGRTDAGVHADGQVVHFDLGRTAPPLSIRERANSSLSWDARLLEVSVAAPEFHARRDAAWKQYVYRWSRAAVIPPRESLFVAPISPRADAARMAEEARQLPGRKDFAIFGVRLPEGESTVRRLISVVIEEDGAEIRATFRGEAFLRGMVRSLCGVLADVARGKAPPGRARELLEGAERRLLSAKAPARGLTLAHVHYASDGEGAGANAKSSD
jgi:tRNA pseudouridine38-40 synthase